MRIRRAARFGVVLLGMAMLASVIAPAPTAHAGAAPFAVQQARLYDDDAATYDDQFGQTVAVSGDLIAVGKPGYDADRGRVYIYKRTGTVWSYVQTLSLPGAFADDRFGHCLAMDGDWLVVGAPHASTSEPTGVARVYRWSGMAFAFWQQLSGETISANERFGESVGIDGDTVVVGAPLDGSGAGSVWPYVWDGDSWETQGTEYASGGDNLGYSVSIAGDMIVASTPGYDVPTGPLVDAGAVAWFTRTGDAWTLGGHKFSPEPRAGDRFGGPLSVSEGGYAMIVGSPISDADIADPADNTGRAFLFTYNGSTWNNYATLANPGANSPDGDEFGSSVDYDDGLVLVCARWDDSHVGAAYYYKMNAGTAVMVQKISEAGASPGVSMFGDSVCIDNGTAVVGATSSGSAGPPLAIMPGSAFVYSSRATITGICRDAHTGLPVVCEEITAYRLDAWGEPQMANADSLMLSGADGRYTLSVDSGQVYLGWMGLVNYQSGWYNDVPMWPQASPLTVWGGNTYTVNINLYPVGSVFRFYNKTNGTHFYTDSWSERNTIIAKYPAIYAYEGIAYKAKPTSNPQPLYRFYSSVIGSHFYTASLAEKNQVVANLSHIYTYEGLSYRVSPVAVPGATVVYRFYNTSQGSHFYTASLAEKNQVIANLSHIYNYEGPAFWLAP